eukprot:scaffold1112_cov116-Isochrysis_galbana.AAC.14
MVAQEGGGGSTHQRRERRSYLPEIPDDLGEMHRQVGSTGGQRLRVGQPRTKAAESQAVGIEPWEAHRHLGWRE